jgi:hypothetical protein
MNYISYKDTGAMSPKYANEKELSNAEKRSNQYYKRIDKLPLSTILISSVISHG